MDCRVLKSKKCEITQGYNNNHAAIDLVAGGYKLDYIVAHSAGKVVFCQDGLNNMKGSSGNQSYGNCVKIDHENGYCTLYAHMQKGLLVKNGQYVKAGQVLGYMSDSGNAYGGHLHFEVWKNGTRVNPYEYLNKEFAKEKSTEELAREVINGMYGNGQERKDKLGDKWDEVQSLVDKMLAPKVDLLDLVRKTINGDFGNNEERKRNLGEKWGDVQHQVDLNYEHGTIDSPRLY